MKFSVCGLPLALLLASPASAQTMAPPERLAAAAHSLDRQPDEGKAAFCEVEPSSPVLNFGLRLEAGYKIDVPLVAYSMGPHAWDLTLRITPENGGSPTYLMDRVDLKVNVHPEMTLQIPGAFLVGEGRYRAELAFFDEFGRVCRREWNINASLDSRERSITPGIPPNTVADLTYSGAPPPQGPPRPARVTVLLNRSEPYKDPGMFIGRLAELAARASVVAEYADYRFRLVSMLSALLERLPGTEVRLVVFDLDRQSESLRQEGFKLADMQKAVHAVDDLEHAVVSVSELQNQPGRWDMVRHFIESEAGAQNPADVVVFLGARIAATERMPPGFPQFDTRARTRFVYLQYEIGTIRARLPSPFEAGSNGKTPVHLSPMTGVAAPEPADPIDLVVRRAKGKTVVIHAPSEFGKAIETVRGR